ncbi:MAG: DUF664 domain-containing protein [Gemmatimonadales bacterium]|jgi:hypothetical protein|nr:DUF664 domain-containing protein [Gemmatimonadales bacterium]
MPGSAEVALLASVRAIVARDLAALRREVEAYGDDDGPWRALPGLANGGGTLVLHLCGNLRHFIGARLGGSGYVRDREAEFRDRDLPRVALLERIDTAAREVDAALAALDPARVGAPFPDAVGGVRLATGDFLVHLATHLTYHLGQADAHRRVVTGSAAAVGALALPSLASARLAD